LGVGKLLLSTLISNSRRIPLSLTMDSALDQEKSFPRAMGRRASILSFFFSSHAPNAVACRDISCKPAFHSAELKKFPLIHWIGCCTFKSEGEQTKLLITFEVKVETNRGIPTRSLGTVRTRAHRGYEKRTVFIRRVIKRRRAAVCTGLGCRFSCSDRSSALAVHFLISGSAARVTTSPPRINQAVAQVFILEPGNIRLNHQNQHFCPVRSLVSPAQSRSMPNHSTMTWSYHSSRFSLQMHSQYSAMPHLPHRHAGDKHAPACHQSAPPSICLVRTSQESGHNLPHRIHQWPRAHTTPSPVKNPVAELASGISSSKVLT